MKKLFILTLLSFTMSFAKADSWTQKATFPGSNRIGCFSFSMGTKGYFGCGYDNNWTTTRIFWEYDQLSNSWTQKADFPDSARVYATGFSIAGNGYAGLGVSPVLGWMQDFWKYDPAINAWSPVDSFPAGGRAEACSFVINNKAYVGTGSGNIAPYIFNDLWEYDPSTNAWTAKASFPGQARIKAMGVSTGSYGYIVTGFASTTYFSDVWQYNPVTNAWIQKANFTGDPRGGAAGFSLLGELYVGTGNNKPSVGSLYPSKDWWRYNQVINQWTQKNSFFGAPRYETGFFAINNKGYVGIGVNANVQYSDFWEYTPDAPSGINVFDPDSYRDGLEFEVYPNPAKESLFISYSLTEKENLEMIIRDIHGKKVCLTQSPIYNTQSKVFKVSLKELGCGIYLVELTNGKERAMKKFVRE
ncbi:MAG TPA: T9SS type A sorting domain-containing protein [Bacteroidia bacterium]|nr:T9SS type A sorting domain-containing protein [Bacteroidia bacterium]